MASYHLGAYFVYTENKTVHHRNIHVQEMDGKLESGAAKTSVKVDGVDPRVLVHDRSTACGCTK